MTKPRRTDSPADELKGMKLLAELPRIGVTAASPRQDGSKQEDLRASTARTAKSSHPAFAELDEFDDEPQYSRRSLHYVDRAHIDQAHDEQQQLSPFEDSPRRRSGVSNAHSRHSLSEHRPSHRRRPGSGAGRMLSGVHEQLTPFAGLIMTAALVACAGLLFLMIAGKRDSAEFDEFALPGFRVEAAEQTLDTVHAPLADSEALSEPFVPEAFPYEPAEIPEQEPPAAKVAPADTSAAVARPIISEITEPSEPLGELFFPVTGTPLALDLSKAVAPTDGELNELPAVAEREEPASSEPINR